MKYGLARNLLFRLDAETAHDLTIQSLKRLEFFGLSGLINELPPAFPVTAMGLEFPNPVGLAAGLDKNGDCIDGMAALGFGHIEIGTTTPKPQPGNPKPRLFRLPGHQAIINRLGFNNKGVDYLVAKARRARFDGVLGINIGKNKDTPIERAVDDYVHCLRKVYPLAGYVTVNISSPNTEGLRELQHDQALRDLLEALLDERESLEKQHGLRVPLAVKIAPDLDSLQIDSLAQTFNTLPPDAVIATNTTITRPQVEADPLAAEAGGLSGRPLLDSANEILKAMRAKLSRDIAMIGVGGVVDAASAASKMEAGADLIQIYTGMIYQGPGLVREAVEGTMSACT
jgi:dihydroorotate dehydrogenase